MKALFTRLMMTGSPSISRASSLTKNPTPSGANDEPRRSAFMANVKDREAFVSKNGQHFNDPGNGIDVVASFTCRFPGIKRTLHVDHNQGGTERRIGGHREKILFMVGTRKTMAAGGLSMAPFPRFRTATTSCF